MGIGDTYRLSEVQTVTVVASGEETNGDLLEVESRWSSGDVKRPGHFHPQQDERFEILEGELVARVGARREGCAPATRSTSRGAPCMRCGTSQRRPPARAGK